MSRQVKPYRYTTACVTRHHGIGHFKISHIICASALYTTPFYSIATVRTCIAVILFSINKRQLIQSVSTTLICPFKIENLYHLIKKTRKCANVSAKL